MKKELQDALLFVEAILKCGFLTGLFVVPLVALACGLTQAVLFRNMKREGERKL